MNHISWHLSVTWDETTAMQTAKMHTNLLHFWSFIKKKRVRTPNERHDSNKAWSENILSSSTPKIASHTHKHLPAEWMSDVRWHTWSQKVSGSEKWIGWREWRTGCKSAGATGRLTSSWSCSPSLCLHQEVCHYKMNLHAQVLWHSHLEAFAWKYKRVRSDAVGMNTITGNSQIFSWKAIYSRFMMCCIFLSSNSATASHFS